MADQIEIMSPNGQVRFLDLDPIKGFTNIGRHPENDIVVDNPDVAPFHAVIDHRQKPYHITILAEGHTLVGGQPVAQNVSRPLGHLDSIELNGHVLLLVEAGALAPDIQARSIPAVLPPVYVPPVAPPSGLVTAPGLGPVRPKAGPGAPPPAPAAPLALGPVASAVTPAESGASMEAIDAALGALDQLEALPPDRTDEYILTEYRAGALALDPEGAALDFVANVEQAASFQVTVVNGGPIVATFRVEIKGLDPSWVTVSPDEVNLNESQRATFNVTLSAPRLPTSRAGPHYFSVVTTSPDHPGRMCATTGVLAINPYYEFAVGELSPRQVKIPYTRRHRLVAVPISNRGNGDAPFRVDAEDNEHGLDFEFLPPGETAAQAKHVHLTVPSDSTLALDLRITPRTRRFIGIGGRNYSYTVTTSLTATAETPRSVLGQARSTPLIGPWVLLLLFLLLLGTSVAVFRPTIKSFQVNGSDRVEIAAGESATLTWDASRFARLTIVASESPPPAAAVGSRPARPAAYADQQIIGPEGGELPAAQGSLEVKPVFNTTYTLKAENILSRVIPRWFTPTRDVFVVVNPRLPSIEFFPDKWSVEVGQTVVVSWEVDRADRVLLERNGAPETILPGEFIASRQFRLDRETTFTLTAFNDYTQSEGRTKSLTVQVITPSPTPLPLPVIRRFDVTPLEITQGELVTISWEVTGAAAVTISGIGELPASGSRTARPDLTTVYVLTASNGQKTVTSREFQVTVNSPPPPTPIPGTPQIEYFYASPEEVAIGTGETQSILLSWSVVGDTTNVEVSGPNFGQATGLPAKGSLTVNTSKPTLFILTAFNGNLTASQTAQVKVLNPVPKIDSIAPSSSTEVNGPGLTLVVKGSGFVEESKVRWEGSNRATAFISSTELLATIPTDDLAVAGTFNVTVFNAVPGGGTSGAVTFTLNNPAPTITSISPASVTKGNVSITLTVNGSNFINGSTIRFGGANMVTTRVSSTQLTAVIPAGQLATAGTPAVTVFNAAPGGGTSNAIAFIINASNPTPTLNGLTADPPGLDPSATVAGAQDVNPLVINGTNFVGGVLVRWNTTLIRPASVSDNRLTVIIPSALISTTLTANITVLNPAPCAANICQSNGLPFSVNSASLTLTPASPSVLVGATSALQVTLGAAPAADTAISLGSTAPGVATVPSSVTITAPSTSATFNVTGVSPGLATITASLPASLGGGTAASVAAVNNPAPTINSLTAVPPGLVPSSAAVGGSLFTLTINGSNFASGAKVNWAGQPDLTSSTITGTTQLTVSVPASYLALAGVYNVTVTNPCFGVGCQSNPQPFTVGAPTINSLTAVPPGLVPSSADAGSQQFTLTVNGTNFVTGSTVRWPGQPILPPFSTTPTQLMVTVPSGYILSNGAVAVRVVNPVNVASNSVNFTVITPTITLSPDPATVALGGTASLTVTLSSPPSANRTITLSSSDSDTVAVTSSVTIVAGSTSTSATVVGVASGSATITATLSGFGNPQDTASVTVNKADTLTTVAKISPTGTPVTGQSVTFRATVKALGGSATPAGTVTFRNGSSDIPGCVDRALTSLDATTATADCSTTSLTSGQSPHTITAVYPGNSDFNGSTSAALSQVVDKANTTVTITSDNPDPSVVGQQITVQGSVTVNSPGSGVPTGTVTVTLSSDTASCTASVTGTGSYSCAMTPTSAGNNKTLTATFGGDSNFNGDSETAAHTVNPASTTITITSDDPDPSVVGQQITVQGSVTVNSPGSGVPTGTVTVTLSSDTATCTASVTGTGSYSCTMTPTAAGNNKTLTATYGGDSNFSGDSETAAHRVNPASTTVTITSDNPDPSGTNVSITVQMSLSVASPGGGTPTGTITVRISGEGEQCTATVSGAGSYQCILSPSPNFSSGGKTITADYGGDSNFNSSTDGEPHTIQ